MDRNVVLLGGCLAVGSSALPQDATLSGVCLAVERPSYKKVEPINDSTMDSIYTSIFLFDRVVGDIDELAKLPRNWDSYGSPEIPKDIIITAKRFINLLEYTPIEPPHVVPISGGGMQFEWQIGERELEIEFVDSENISYLKVNNEEPIDESQIKSSDVIAIQGLIRWLRGF
ncbi:MAG: hypothetical protein K9M75_02665 [Phycisphaerae bacterium]|nr:hypothetical protein [Phycisphaerae bacterium]